MLRRVPHLCPNYLINKKLWYKQYKEKMAMRRYSHTVTAFALYDHFLRRYSHTVNAFALYDHFLRRYSHTVTAFALYDRFLRSFSRKT
jgi:hypothetical protein